MHEEDRLQTRVAKAIYNASVNRVREKIRTIDVQHDKIDRVMTEARGETDRSAAILLFALMDDTLSFYLKQFLNPRIKGGLESVFEGSAMLSTAHSRITLAAMLHWIQQQTYADLNLVRRIRNVFAHHTEIRSFEDRSVVGMIHSMSKYEQNLVEGFKEKITAEISTRSLFILRCCLLQERLINDLVVLRASIAGQVSPNDVMSIDWKESPHNLRQLSYINAKVFMILAQIEDSSGQAEAG